MTEPTGSGAAAEAASLGEFSRRAGEFLDSAIPANWSELEPAELIPVAREFQAALYDAGFAGITWPAEYGGQGATAAHEQAFREQAAGHDLPTGPFVIGLGMCGPTLVDLGTDRQRERYVRPLLRGEEIWCQLFSEPDAGSDVASLRTKAVRDGEDWIVTGQKVWTSGARHADFGALLARTDPDVPKHAGLTMFIVDMRAPGVAVRPLRDMTGRSPFNEVHFDQVRLPADAVLGEVGAGWRAAVTMLGHERVSLGGATRRRDEPLGAANLARLARENGTAAVPQVRAELAGLHAAERALELFSVRLRQEAESGTPPGARGSVGKLGGAMLLWQALHAAGEIAGTDAVAWEPGDEAAEELAVAINAVPASSIAGGTNNVQRNIIGERILGLPKEPQVDRDVPFRDLRVGTQRETT
ncbi:alkylation response protein AidB-like acyl-CoA dehydrogenase [Saccharopolyspora gloriosae]|uniref:Alkylation response protein AidB-like acyl-CoA dehydrogenase n=1 Tax=Saccharopolyspora gloriosae TaxID=455344 RepID=A0A840NMF8_9PSEU|nr:acyl-CoA dehydrogenase family protein [Saccharopolyspora gloriosae]MBB5069437.1 alkylation response protein AidB-like acyl-CoA dehydrogenase [Saccharopolyspora gloriosae]